MASFEYVVDAEYDEAGDLFRPEETLTVYYNRHSLHDNSSYEITDVMRTLGGRLIAFTADELLVLLGGQYESILQEAAHDDWLEYGSDR